MMVQITALWLPDVYFLLYLFTIFQKAASCKPRAMSLIFVEKYDFPYGEMSKRTFENECFSHFTILKLAALSSKLAAL